MFNPDLTYCAANRVGGGNWCVGGCIPSMQDRTQDETHVFFPVRSDVYKTLSPVRILTPQSEGGHASQREWLVEHGYLTPFYKRSFETLERTMDRRFRTARSRLRAGLPVSIPNAVRP